MVNWFECVMDIGEKMLISGAEVHRVEESVSRMCQAFGAKRVDVFIITSSMVVTVCTKEGETYTQTRRVTSIKFDVEKLHRLNELSREICQNNLSLEEIQQKVNEADSCKQFPFWAELLSYAVIAGAFTYFFGGTVIEMVVSFFIGALVCFSVKLSDKVLFNKVFAKFYSSAITTFLAFAAVYLGLISNVDKVIIGNIMTLIPGIGLTNAIRDLFTGDSIAGLLRLIEAALTALAIAAGYYMVVVIGGLFV